MKTVLGSQPWLSDPSLHPIPWRAEIPHLHRGGKKLTVGVMWDDGVVQPAPAVTRALKEIVGRLKTTSDVDVIEWKPYQQENALEILVGDILIFQSHQSDHNMLTAILDKALCP